MAVHLQPGLVSGRLTEDDLAGNFAELHPPMTAHEATVAADRCYFCHDAPCITACPTSIDIPLFIRQIATGTPEAAARTIFEQNILGGMCARVCPTETLCEEACVREAAEGKPVKIGELQRYATDTLMEAGVHPFERAAPTGKRVAVVGAGPAGLACAHRLAMKGHDVTIFERRPKPGGLNEYGIATYKTVDDFAAREVDWLMKIGGIEVSYGRSFGGDLTMEELTSGFDAVFLGVGLGGVNDLGLDADGIAGITPAVDFIAALRQAETLSGVRVGRDVVVIGGGMTAIDAAVQARLLGALNVTIAYRRGRDRMAASRYEQDLAASKGVRIITNVSPVGVAGNGHVAAVEFQYTDNDLNPIGDRFAVPADHVLVAIGQTLEPGGLPETERGKFRVDAVGRTSVPGVWAGGDCTVAGEDLTVTAVAQGRDAAEDIHRALTA